jgi:hypothetical protein
MSWTAIASRYRRLGSRHFAVILLNLGIGLPCTLPAIPAGTAREGPGHVFDPLATARTRIDLGAAACHVDVISTTTTSTVEPCPSCRSCGMRGTLCGPCRCRADMSHAPAGPRRDTGERSRPFRCLRRRAVASRRQLAGAAGRPGRRSVVARGYADRDGEERQVSQGRGSGILGAADPRLRHGPRRGTGVLRLRDAIRRDREW